MRLTSGTDLQFVSFSHRQTPAEAAQLWTRGCSVTWCVCLPLYQFYCLVTEAHVREQLARDSSVGETRTSDLSITSPLTIQYTSGGIVLKTRQYCSSSGCDVAVVTIIATTCMLHCYGV